MNIGEGTTTKADWETLTIVLFGMLVLVLVGIVAYFSSVSSDLVRQADLVQMNREAERSRDEILLVVQDVAKSIRETQVEVRRNSANIAQLTGEVRTYMGLRGLRETPR